MKLLTDYARFSGILYVIGIPFAVLAAIIAVPFISLGFSVLYVSAILTKNKGETFDHWMGASGPFGHIQRKFKRRYPRGKTEYATPNGYC